MTLSREEIGELSRKLLISKETKPQLEIKEELFCSPPEPCIAADKPAILFLGMNPAGNEADAAREKKTNGLFLYYYEEFFGKNGLSEHFINRKKYGKRPGYNNGLVYADYYKPIYEFFEKITGKPIAWEWCNYKPDELFDLIRKTDLDLTAADENCLKKCLDKYNNESEYQLIIRDLVYYHQTNGFEKLLKKVSDDGVREIVADLINAYIKQIPDLKLIYVSFAKTCDYIYTLTGCDDSYLTEYTTDNEDKSKLDEYGCFEYKGIPVILAGCSLGGGRALDKYSRFRVGAKVKEILKVNNHK